MHKTLFNPPPLLSDDMSFEEHDRFMRAWAAEKYNILLEEILKIEDEINALEEFGGPARRVHALRKTASNLRDQLTSLAAQCGRKDEMFDRGFADYIGPT